MAEVFAHYTARRHLNLCYSIVTVYTENTVCPVYTVRIYNRGALVDVVCACICLHCNIAWQYCTKHLTFERLYSVHAKVRLSHYGLVYRDMGG